MSNSNKGTLKLEITNAFKNTLKNPSQAVILFKAHIVSSANHNEDDIFAFCDYVDEDTLVADVPGQRIGDIQATSITFLYLSIPIESYHEFITGYNGKIDRILSIQNFLLQDGDSTQGHQVTDEIGWRPAFKAIDIGSDSSQNSLNIEVYGYNYVFFDFSKYNLNCSIQLLNTFDKEDREFIHSHYHSKNLESPDIIALNEKRLGYYDDIEYSKITQDSDSKKVNESVLIDQDYLESDKPNALKLKTIPNYVRMFRPEEYYHMGDFTVKLLGKPLQKTKYDFSVNEVDHNAGKESREDLKVLAVTNPDKTDETRDLQYVDMFDYNKYLQPVFRMWDKNNKYVDFPNSDKPYLYTIDNFDLTKKLTTFFRLTTSSSKVDVVISFKSTNSSAPTADDFTASIYSTEDPSLNSASHDERLYKVQFSYVEGKLRIYYYMKDCRTILLEAGVKADISSSASEDDNKKSNVIIKESGITGTGTDIAVTIVTKKDNQFGVIGNTFEPMESESDINIWNQGKLLPLSDKNPTLVFGTKCTPDASHKSQYAKFIFNNYDSYLGNAIPNGGVAVTLQGGQDSSQSDAVLFGVPYLCVTKNMKVHGTSYLNEVSASNVDTSGTTKTKYLNVIDTSNFDKEATFKSTVKFYDTLKYEGTSTRNFLKFIKTTSDGDGIILSGCQGLTVIGSGDSCGNNSVTDLTTINSKFNQTTYHPGISSFAPSSATEWTGNNEELMLLSDNSVFVLTNCQYTSRLYQFKNDESRFIVYGGGSPASVRVTNNNGAIELQTNSYKGLFDPGTSKWLIASNADGLETVLQAGTVTISNALHVGTTLTVDSTARFNNTVAIAGSLNVSSLLKVTGKAEALNVPKELTSVGSPAVADGEYINWGAKSSWTVGQVKHIFNDTGSSISIQLFLTNNASGSSSTISNFNLPKGCYFDAMCLAYQSWGSLGEFGVFAILGMTTYPPVN